MNETSDKRCALFKQLDAKVRICLFFMKAYLGGIEVDKLFQNIEIKEGKSYFLKLICSTLSIKWTI